MAGVEGNDMPRDGELVAYLDGNLDDEARAQIGKALERDGMLRERLSLLERGNRPFEMAFGVLAQDAPLEKLQSMMAELLSTSAEQTPILPQMHKTTCIKPTSERSSFASLAAIAAIFVALLFSGIASGYIVGQRSVKHPAKLDWRDAVSVYVNLYNRATVVAMPSGAMMRKQSLAMVSKAVGLELKQDRISAPGLQFKGAKILQFNSTPLAQLIYLSKDGIPVAFCIIKKNGSRHELQLGIRQSVRQAYWSNGSHEFIVVGKLSKNALRVIAKTLLERFS